MPKVSVIVPVYNVEEYIEKCLQTLTNQTLKDIEIIIINDGSKDSSEKIILEYKEKYPEMISYYKKENGGLSDARNYGIPYATGEYIAFLDSDDYIEHDMYEIMYEKAVGENSDMIECNFYWEYPKKRKEDIGQYYETKNEMLVKARVVAWNKLIKAEIIRKSNVLFPKGLRYEDIEFFYKLVPYLNKISFIKLPLVHYIQRQNSISNNQNEKTKDIFQILQNVLTYYKEKEIYEEYKEELEYIYTRYLLCSSFLRMVHIKDKKIRKEAISKTWENLNNNFPQWEKNRILNLKQNKKDNYMKTVNQNTIWIYEKLFRII